MNRRILFAAMTSVAAFCLPLRAAYLAEWQRSNWRPTTANVSTMFSVDMNHDNRPDVLLRTGTNQVLLALTQSDGTLGTPAEIYATDYLASALTADATGDGNLDLIISDTATNTIEVAPGNGNGTFTAAVTTTLNFAPTQIASGDFNSDGKIDLAIRSYSASMFAIYNGDGAGHFSEASRTAVTNSASLRTADIDHDGKADVMITEHDALRHRFFFGNGDGTFAAPVTVPFAYAPIVVSLGDVDGDGDLDVITGERSQNSVTVVLNMNGRSFGPAAPYVVSLQYGASPYGIAIDDVNGDGNADLLVTVPGEYAVDVLPGFGDGTFGAIEKTRTVIGTNDSQSLIELHDIAIGNFSGVARKDFVAVYLDPSSGQYGVIVFENHAGEVVATLTSDADVLTVGSTLPAHVFLVAVGISSSVLDVPKPTGSVTVKDGTTAVGTATLTNGSADLTINAMPAGTHALTLAYSGDAHYKPMTLPAKTITVTTQKTTTTLSTDLTPPNTVRYGGDLQVVAHVTSELGGTVSGPVALSVDGVAMSSRSNAPSAVFSVPTNLTIGSHTLTASYLGNSTQPPSTAAPLALTIIKAATSIRSNIWYGPAPAGATRQSDFSLSTISSFGGVGPKGNIAVFEGSARLTDTPVTENRYSIAVNLPVLGPGMHYLRVMYEGDANYEPCETVIQFPVLAGTVFPLVATATWNSNSSPVIYVWGYYTLPAGGYFKFWHRIGREAWSFIRMDTTPQFEETGVMQNTAYTYRMTAHAADGTLVATSDSDIALFASYTDDPLNVTTPIKALHIQQLITVLNVVRDAAGYAPFSLTGIAAGQPLKVSQIEALRTAINDARVALGASAYSFSEYITTGGIVRAKHLQDLREAMR
ncbi:MAG TPA: FG-GAP-like repeat-containing protein [Thermoanaerobaculia bacterium]|nr:FG-GAP-like repeat-containing protein [Thermoanaerobaculia bacterium]